MKMRERLDHLGLALAEVVAALTDPEVASRMPPITVARLGKVNGELGTLGYKIEQPPQLSLVELIRDETRLAVAQRDWASVGRITGAVADWILERWGSDQPAVKATRRATQVQNPHDARVIDFLHGEVADYLAMAIFRIKDRE